MIFERYVLELSRKNIISNLEFKHGNNFLFTVDQRTEP